MKHLFAIGDIHGCFDSLRELVENKIQPDKDDKLVLLGDYIDRGDKMFISTQKGTSISFQKYTILT